MGPSLGVKVGLETRTMAPLRWKAEESSPSTRSALSRLTFTELLTARGAVVGAALRASGLPAVLVKVEVRFALLAPPRMKSPPVAA